MLSTVQSVVLLSSVTVNVSIIIGHIFSNADNLDEDSISKLATS